MAAAVTATTSMSAARLQLLLMAAAAAFFQAITMSSAALQYNFYSSSCPDAEKTISKAVYDLVDANPSVAPALIRLYFHDCFVVGCDGSILLDSSSANPRPEKSVIPLAAAGYDAIDTIKAAVEVVCPGKVSCADVLAFAARDAVTKSAGGSFNYSVPSGRRDGTSSKDFTIITAIPSPLFGIKDLVGSFTRKGLTADDLVDLSGAHSIGTAHCASFSNRLYPSVDASLDAAYAADLMAACPGPSLNPDPVVNNNAAAPPTLLSNQFFNNALAKRVLFTSDAALLNSTYTAQRVAENAANPATWAARFAASMVRMGNIGVLTGSQGQVRTTCRATN